MSVGRLKAPGQDIPRSKPHVQGHAIYCQPALQDVAVILHHQTATEGAVEPQACQRSALLQYKPDKKALGCAGSARVQGLL